MLLPVPVSHLIRPITIISTPDPPTIPVIARGMTAVSFVHGVFMLQAMRATTSASSSPSSLGVVVTAGMLRHGGYQLAARTTLRRKAQAKPLRLSPATSLISPTHNPSRIRQSPRNCRRR